MRVVVALGGNALERPDEEGSYEELVRNVRIACVDIVNLIRAGHDVVVTHGNGPQVGNLALQQEKSEGDIPIQPLHVLGSMTQGQIGYMIERELINRMNLEGHPSPVVTVITQILVDRSDAAFKNPTKPIGPFYDAEGADRLVKERGVTMMKVKAEGKRIYRRVVPSPEPLGIVEAETLGKLVESGAVVIACGGGGIPVTQNKKGELEGIDAVIDKDLAAEKLAESVRAEALLILTDVDSVKLDFGKPTERSIALMTVSEARKRIAEGQFLKGSMLPKVTACVRFVESGGEHAIICALGRALDGIKGKSGTRVAGPAV